MIEVKNLTKKYGPNTAVNNISFTIEKGKIYGFLGPNGAGKSTTMNIITGCLAATSGTVLVDGHDIFEEPVEAKKHIGYLPELPPLYTEMTVLEYLNFVSEAKGVSADKRIREVKNVMKLTGLEEKADRLIRNMSKGYRQRVGIAQAMLGDPDVIILDEPTVGLDPKQIIEIRELIKALGRTKTVVLSSHILSEISAVCDHVIIISHGKVVANDSLEALESRASRRNGLCVSARCSAETFRKILSGISDIGDVEYDTKDGMPFAVLNPEKDTATLTDRVFNAFAAAKVPLYELCYRESSLETIFLELTGNPYEDDGLFSGLNGDDDNATQGTSAEPEETEAPEDDYKPLFGGSDEEDK